jgi:hypothetical protein
MQQVGDLSVGKPKDGILLPHWHFLEIIFSILGNLHVLQYDGNLSVGRPKYACLPH